MIAIFYNGFLGHLGTESNHFAANCRFGRFVRPMKGLFVSIPNTKPDYEKMVLSELSAASRATTRESKRVHLDAAAR